MDYNNKYLNEFYNKYLNYVMTDNESDNIFYQIIRNFAYGLLDTDYGEWIKISLNNNDMQGVNNVIYHQCKINLMPLGSGYDHCGNFLPVMEAIACGYYNAVEHCYPRYLTLPSNGYTLYVLASNLLIGIWYQDESIIKKIEPKVVKYLNAKGNQWDKNIVNYLYHLYKKDEIEVNKSLKDICDGFSKQNFSKDKKILCVLAHGLVMLTYLKYPDININLPSTKIFSPEYINWRKENLTPQLELYLTYPKELEEVNKVLKSDIVDVVIHQPYKDNTFMSSIKRKQWVIDTEQIHTNLANKIAQQNE